MAESSAAALFELMIAGLSESGLSLREIARRSQLSPATIHRGATGICRRPGYETVQRLEQVWIQRGSPVCRK
jgi:transcriptional regulator with XRE-family HTH domain